MTKRKKQIQPEISEEKIVRTEYSEEMQQSFVDYSMSVIVSRAIPDIRDGLKPVHRRILYTMNENGLNSDKQYVKCADVVGSVLGRYHPHGDSSVYDALVVMGQDWKKSVKLIDGNGNFGSIEGDVPAAYRYCVTGDTYINTNKGLIKINELVKNSKSNSDNPIDICVTNFNGNRAGSKMLFNSGKHPIIKVVTKDGYEIKGSENHPIAVATTDSLGKPGFKWKRLDEITMNDEIIIFVGSTVSSNRDFIEENEAKMLGALFANGYVDYNNNKVEFISDNMELVTKMKIWMTQYFHANLLEYKSTNSEHIKLEANLDNDFKYFIDKYELKAGLSNASVPKYILQSTQKIQKLFLQYFFEGSAIINGKHKKGDKDDVYIVEIITHLFSNDLLHQIQLLLLSFGIYSKKVKLKTGENGLSITGKNSIINFCKQINFVSFEKQKRTKIIYETIINNPEPENIKIKTSSKYRCTNIKSITKLPAEDVYSVRVDSKCHSYIANGFINHNTECRLTKFTEDSFLDDLNKDTVDFVTNYDERREEPSILPAKIPNVLVNGTEGIAVGMTTNTPPHNLTEIMNGYKAYIDNKKITIKELMEIVKGPDFPTGGIVANKNDLKEIYETGKGKIRIRGKIKYEPGKKKNDKDLLIITEIPYTMIGSGINKFLSDVADLVKSKKLPEVTDIMNQSSKEGIRLVIELKKGSDYKRVENILYKKTRLEDTFGVNMLYVVSGRPEQLNLKDIYKHFLDFQIETKTRKYTALLKKEKEKKEIQEGLIDAINIIDLIIEILRGSKNTKMAKECLMGRSIDGINFKTRESKKTAKQLKFTEIQAQSILDMRLSKLIGLELDLLIKDRENSIKLINKYEKILKSKKEMFKLIKSEADDIIKKYGYNRKTKIDNLDIVNIDLDKIEEKDIAFAIDKFNYVKTYDLAIFKKNEDFIKNENKKILICKNTDSVCIFTDTGNMHQVKCMDIPLIKLKDKGVPLDNISNFNSSAERILNIISKENLSKIQILFTTKNGFVKVVPCKEFLTNRKTIVATKLNKDDKIISIIDNIETQLVIQSKNGLFIRFPIDEIPKMKKTSIGVQGIKLKNNDEVTNVYSVQSRNIPSISVNNKEISLSKVKLVKRGGVGTKIRL